MDTTENEIKALRREIDALRKENIAVHNELANQNMALFEQVISIGKQLTQQHNDLNRMVAFYGGANLHDDLKMHLTRVTAAQSAKFIIEKMPKVISFDELGKYLKYVLSHTKSVSGGGIWSSEFIRATA